MADPGPLSLERGQVAEPVDGGNKSGRPIFERAHNTKLRCKPLPGGVISPHLKSYVVRDLLYRESGQSLAIGVGL